MLFLSMKRNLKKSMLLDNPLRLKHPWPCSLNKHFSCLSPHTPSPFTHQKIVAVYGFNTSTALYSTLLFLLCIQHVFPSCLVLKLAWEMVLVEYGVDKPPYVDRLNQTTVTTWSYSILLLNVRKNKRPMISLLSVPYPCSINSRFPAANSTPTASAQQPTTSTLRLPPICLLRTCSTLQRTRGFLLSAKLIIYIKDAWRKFHQTAHSAISLQLNTRPNMLRLCCI